MATIKHFLSYSLGSLIVKTLLWIAAPVALYTLPAHVMGLWSLANAFIALSSIILALGLRQVFFIEYYHKDARERRVMINEIIVLYMLYALPIMCIAWSMRAYINQYFFASAATDQLLLFCFCACFISFFTELLYQVLMYSKKVWLLISIQITGALVTAGISLITLYVHAQVLGLILAQLAGLVVVCIAGFWLYIKKLVHKAPLALCVQKVRMYMLQGLPFVPSVISFWLLSTANRWILASYASLADVGTYACAEMVSMLFQMLVLYPLSGAYLPGIFEKFAQYKDDLTLVDAENKRVMRISMSVLLVIGTIIFFVAKPFLYAYMPAAYVTIIPYLLLVGIGNVFLMGTYFASAYIQYRKKTLFLAGSLIICAICNVVLSFFWVKRYEVAGCIAATSCSYFIYFVLTYWYNTQLHKNSTKPLKFS